MISGIGWEEKGAGAPLRPSGAVDFALSLLRQRQKCSQISRLKYIPDVRHGQ